MASMTDEQRDAFLAVPRLGILSTLADDGAPVAVPVWFEWDGRSVRMFSSATSAKLRRLARDPRASLLVTNAVGEPEAWVAFDGAVTVRSDGAIELAERLAACYWDLADGGRRTTLAAWRRAAASFRLLELMPSRIRSMAE